MHIHQVATMCTPSSHLVHFSRHLHCTGAVPCWVTLLDVSRHVLGGPIPPPPKNCSYVWESGPPSCFLGLTRVHIPNDISIGSAVSAGLTIVTDHAPLSAAIGCIYIVWWCSMIVWRLCMVCVHVCRGFVLCVCVCVGHCRCSWSWLEVRLKINCLQACCANSFNITPFVFVKRMLKLKF